MLLLGKESEQFFVRRAMSGINAIIANHFEMLFRDMPDEAPDKINGGNGFMNKGVIFVPVIVKGKRLTIVGINAGGGDRRSAKVAADIFNNRIRVGKVGFCINVEALLAILIKKSFSLFERRAEMKEHFIKESGTKGMAEKRIGEMVEPAPGKGVANPAFGNETMDIM